MKITLKTLKKEQFQVEVDENLKVLAIKEELEKQKGFPVSSQKLIFSGKILQDDQVISDIKIQEKDFLVVMVTKPAASSASASSPKPTAQTSSTPASAPAPAPAPAPTPAPVAPVPAQASSPVVPPTTPAAPVMGLNPTPAPTVEPAGPLDDTLLTGSRFETAIQGMVEMGFPREECMRAMRAAFNNADRAVEYLMTGIPAHLVAQSNPTPAPAPTSAPASAPASTPSTAPTAAATTGAAPAAQGQQQQQQPQQTPQNLFTAAAQAAAQAERGTQGAQAGSLDFLRDEPQFQQLRDLVQQNPALLQPLLAQLGQSNPQMLQLISQNQQAFLDLLHEGMEDGPTQVYVTEDEQEAIQRLEALGFDRQIVLEAYLACDRDEEMAANYLFEHGHDDEEGGDFQ
ncbi:UV excision repair protein RAD23 B [Actinomortierella ambigua]|uniref:UV excision repair protein RAD23 n=1 Tax=Actinomortierella ambigua TaxID=1343610 RepID=A0A9P6Q973_9FUNG|nr:UV excision repair protein RAD23 B [Actinomortierella ambigua]